MLFAGIFLVFLISFLAWREYKLFLVSEARELSEFISFIRTMRERMKCYLEPLSAWVSEYSSDELERVGFLSAVRESGDFCASYELSRDNMSLSEEAKSVISEMLSHMGDGYLESELSAIDAGLARLSEIEKRISGDCKNKSQAAGAMLAAIVIGVAILVI